ncbi:hypothetical protein GOBAR_DD36703 [Gossypium barbadense]|nr:hypothetical protein GOBAR_DD36703 [Gossypium barbadense]
MNRVPAPYQSVQLIGTRTLPATIMPFMLVISIVRNRNTSTYEVATTLMGYAPFPLFFAAYYTNTSKVHCKLLLVREILLKLNVLCIQYVTPKVHGISSSLSKYRFTGNFNYGWSNNATL